MDYPGYNVMECSFELMEVPWIIQDIMSWNVHMAKKKLFLYNMRHIDYLEGGRQEEQPELQVEGWCGVQPKRGAVLHRPVFFHTTVPHTEMQRGTGVKFNCCKC